MIPGRYLLIPLILLGGLGSAVAFQRGATRWEGAETTFFTGMPGRAASGTLFAQAFRDAMGSWTSKTAFRFNASTAYQSPCTGYQRSSSGSNFPAGDGDGRNGADFRADVCGNDFGEGTLAITLNSSSDNSLGFAYLTESDIIFNSAYDWDVYEGPRREAVDFYRVAVHELGHAMGLQHELRADAIMRPRIGELRDITSDDIAGANDIYALQQACAIATVQQNARVRGALEIGDCRIRDLFNTGDDDSRVDVYRLTLARQTSLGFTLGSTALDPVLLILTPDLQVVDVFDADDGQCELATASTLPAGEYLVLVNTFTNARTCGSTGEYALTITDSFQPFLGDARASDAAPADRISFQGGASRDKGASFVDRFTATDSVDVSGRIVVDPEHAGLPGSVYVVAVLSNGRAFMRTPAGFIPFSGQLADLEPLRSGILDSVEDVEVVTGLRGVQSGLAGLGINVFIGYATQAAPTRIYYPTRPVSFTLDP